METVNEHLATSYGLMLSAPPFVKTSIDAMRSVVVNPDVKETAGVFNYTQGWTVITECLLGHGGQAEGPQPGRGRTGLAHWAGAGRQSPTERREPNH